MKLGGNRNCIKYPAGQQSSMNISHGALSSGLTSVQFRGSEGRPSKKGESSKVASTLGHSIPTSMYTESLHIVLHVSLNLQNNCNS